MVCVRMEAAAAWKMWMMPNLEDVLIPLAAQEEILHWFEDVILPESSAEGTFEKFLDELAELRTARRHLNHIVENEPEVDPVFALEHLEEEAADVIISYLAWCYAEGLRLRQAVRNKHKTNLGRKWGPPDDRGVRRHVV